jgi:Zn-dependent M28 family amino/carboxypeptidase
MLFETKPMLRIVITNKPTIMKNPLIRKIALLVIAIILIVLAIRASQPRSYHFDGQRSFADLERQMSFGPRIPGSEAHNKTIEYIRDVLEENRWSVDIQETSLLNQPIRNVVGKRGSGTPWVILGAHYDSRLKADHDSDPKKREQPVPGANDGASGVAVLLELARVIPKNLEGQVWLVFFDAEDNGRIPGWDWILGSQAFVRDLEGKPDAVVIIDMIGDANLNIYEEMNSNPDLTREVWDVAASLGYSKEFIPQPDKSILDDHTPFLRAGIPAIDIIDFDYPYYHTSQDTLDKVSAASLQAVGDTLLEFLTQRNRKQ